MLILALETSAKAASVALCEDKKLLAQFYMDIGLTHSETVLPATEAMLNTVSYKIEDIDLFAVAAGPGSFTGLRIGMAGVKAMAFAGHKPVVGVSTLEGLAYNGCGIEGPLCAVMDARCNQVYTALFTCDGEKPVRLCEDKAVSTDTLHDEIEALYKKTGKRVFLIGDGANLCYNLFGDEICRKAPPQSIYAHAVGVAMAGYDMAIDGKTQNAEELRPNYLRLPQAEREKLAKEGAVK